MDRVEQNVREVCVGRVAIGEPALLRAMNEFMSYHCSHKMTEKLNVRENRTRRVSMKDVPKRPTSPAAWTWCRLKNFLKSVRAEQASSWLSSIPIVESSFKENQREDERRRQMEEGREQVEKVTESMGARVGGWRKAGEQPDCPGCVQGGRLKTLGPL